MNIEFLKGKKLAIVGFGKEGQATFEFLKKSGLEIAAVLDMNTSLDDKAKHKLGATKFISGPSYLDSLDVFEILFRSPGIPRLHPKLVSFSNQELVYSHTKLFFDLCPCPIIAITGTKGKTTTATLIYEIFKSAGKKVFLGGNIGEPPLNFLPELDSESVAVLEVSSFQAQDLHKSPHIGVVLNVTFDHLDDGTYKPASHSSIEEYEKAKAQLIAHQSENDIAVIHPSLADKFLNSGRGKKIVFNPSKVQHLKRQLLGKHNLENIAAAYEACFAFGITKALIEQAIGEFKGVPQRLEIVAEKNGITFINDSASTNPDSTVAAINALNTQTVLVIGGSEKGLDYSSLGKTIISSHHLKALVIIGEIAPVLVKVVEGYKGKILTGAKNMNEIMQQVLTLAMSGDTVLFSPGAASFDMFANSKDRGNQFNEAVRTI